MPSKYVMNITMPPEVRKKLKTLAEIEHRSESNMIHHIIENYYFQNKEKIKKLKDEI